jgi:hypothetical protein
MATMRTIKKGDRYPYLEVWASYTDTSLDLTGELSLATVTTFTMRQKGGSVKVNAASAAVTEVDTANRRVKLRYQWASGDTDTAGEFRGEFTVTVSGRPMTIPTTGYVTIRVLEDQD